MVVLLPTVLCAAAHAEKQPESNTNLSCTLTILSSVKAYEAACFPGLADDKSAAIDDAVQKLQERAVALSLVPQSHFDHQMGEIAAALKAEARRSPQLCAEIKPDDPRKRTHARFVYDEIRRLPADSIRAMARELTAVPVDELTQGCL